ncbi:MAG: hypothetical protein JSS10_04380 [Verrucomicrobia bacterium]|nr:hypothetical protein [Verrucomicrobiota bacterium]
MKISRWNSKFWLTLLVLFLLVFPKGGFKIAEVPLTWGYLLLALTSLYHFLRNHLAISSSHLRVLLALLPFQLLSLGLFFIQGINHSGFALAFITHFFLLPFLMFALLSKFMQNFDLQFFIPLFKKSLLFISVYGIFLFFYRIGTGNFLLIPFLTSNFHDIDSIEIAKCIARGDLFKLFSTYGNGNLYGICLLMLLPLYQLVEESFLKRSIVKLSLLLTLSRTVWIGLLLEEIFRHLYIQKPTSSTLTKLASRLLAIGLMIGLGLAYLNYDLSFIFDPTLGGRSELLNVFSEWTWIVAEPFEGISEIVYLSVLKSFGLIGLIFFLVAITSPLWVYVFFTKTQTTPLQRSLITGLCVYLFISCSDGAILYIPVMVFYWFLSSLLLGKHSSIVESCIITNCCSFHNQNR